MSQNVASVNASMLHNVRFHVVFGFQMASDAPADEVIASHQSNDVRITIGKVKVVSHLRLKANQIYVNCVRSVK